MTGKTTQQPTPDSKLKLEEKLIEIPPEFFELIEEEDEHECCSCPEHMKR
jgi:hypothetical protein